MFAAITVVSPVDYQVFQRLTRTQGEIHVVVSSPEAYDTIEARIGPEAWRPVTSSLVAPAGGWYRVEVRILK